MNRYKAFDRVPGSGDKRKAKRAANRLIRHWRCQAIKSDLPTSERDRGKLMSIIRTRVHRMYVRSAMLGYKDTRYTITENGCAAIAKAQGAAS